MKQLGARMTRVSAAWAAALLTIPALAAYPQQHGHPSSGDIVFSVIAAKPAAAKAAAKKP